MPNAILEQMTWDEDKGSEQLYRQMYLRRQVVRHLLEFWDLLGEAVKEDIRMQYGRPDSEIDGKMIRTTKKKIGKDLKEEEYGFSVSQWCHKIITNRFWCDEIFLKVLASMWGCRITVVRSDSLHETRYRHDLPLKMADIILLFNCNPWNGHYSAVVNCGEGLAFNTCEIAPVRFSASYRKSDDLDERLKRGDELWDLDSEKKIFTAKRGYKFVKEDEEEKKKGKGKDEGDDDKGDKGGGGVQIRDDEIVVKKDEWDEMKRELNDMKSWKRKFMELEKVVDQLKEKLKEDKGEGMMVSEKNMEILRDSVLKLGRNIEAVAKGKEPDEVDVEIHTTPRKRHLPYKPPTPEMAKMVKKKRVDVERTVSTEVEDYEPGDRFCKRCNYDCGSSSALASHFSKFHKNEYLYFCEECGKGFMTKQGYEAHANAHNEKERLKCPRGCSKTFVTKGAMKKHVKEIHDPKPEGYKKPECQFCGKKFRIKGNLTEHILGCDQNPDRKPIYCDECGEDKSPVFFLKKRVMEHKRKTHGWD